MTMKSASLPGSSDPKSLGRSRYSAGQLVQAFITVVRSNATVYVSRSAFGWSVNVIRPSGPGFASHTLSQLHRSVHVNVGESAAGRANLARWFSQLRSGSHYEAVALFDGQLQLRFALPDTAGLVGPVLRAHLANVSKTADVSLIDLRQRRAAPGIRLDLLVPIRDGAAQPDASGRLIGVILLRMNPDDFLYPLIRSWPTASKSAETLLVRREGDEIVFLN